MDGCRICQHPLWNGKTSEQRETNDEEIATRIHVNVLQTRNANSNDHTYGHRETNSKTLAVIIANTIRHTATQTNSLYRKLLLA